ncbi:hypothetical protein [Oceanobacillus senegalensis]|uniref:hypothetical protein n=1 Tax=Oceanobacillus senegalensis TaxID=1936063 RepID=UPI000A30CAFA|nr:hypothetical protein [Oceanobacillus senegalensis]
MTSWVSWVAVGLIVSVLIYAFFSLYLKKPIAAAFHIVLGILSLPSIGLYVDKQTCYIEYFKHSSQHY